MELRSGSKVAYRRRAKRKGGLVDMPDGSVIIIGQNNTATSPTNLVRSGGSSNSVLRVENESGGGIFGQGGGTDPFPLSTPGLSGDSLNGVGVYGNSNNNSGVFGYSNNDTGVWGMGSSGMGIYGSSDSIAVQGVSTSNSGVFGHSQDAAGVYGDSRHSTGVIGRSETGLAGLFLGGVEIQGPLTAATKPFRIDHPLDPENKYLNHVSVESPQMKNVYDGVVELDEDGASWVQLPEYFEELNRDFCYQLSAIRAPAPHLHIAEEVSENHFKIGGGEPGMKVSWQITGIRKDRWASANPIEVEQEKSAEERGRYLYPELYGESEELGVGRPISGARVEELRRQAGELRRQAEEHRRRMEVKRRQVEAQRQRRTEGQQEEPPPPPPQAP